MTLGYMNLKHIAFFLENFHDIELMMELDRRARQDLPIYLGRFVASNLKAILQGDEEITIDYFDHDDGDDVYWSDRRLYDEDADYGLFFGLSNLSIEAIVDSKLRSRAPFLYAYVTGSGRRRKMIDRIELKNSISAARRSLALKGYMFDIEHDDIACNCAKDLAHLFNLSLLKEPAEFVKALCQEAVEFTREIIIVADKSLVLGGK